MVVAVAVLIEPVAEIDVAETRGFCEETGIAPVCSLGLPPEFDVIADPDAGLAFLEPAFKVANGVGAFALVIGGAFLSGLLSLRKSG